MSPGPAGPPVFDAPEFLARLRRHDEAAVDHLIESITPRLLSVARNLMPTEADALDAIQDAFLSAFRSLDSFDGRSKLSTWLHQITVNACLMRLRTRRRRPETSIEALLPTFRTDGHQTNPQKQWDAHPISGIVSQELGSLIRSKLRELPDSYRVVLVLRDVQGLDTDATATVLGITSDAVRTRLHRARQALKTLLDPFFTEDNRC